MTHRSTPDVSVRRTYQVYLYAVCFVAILIALFAASQMLWGLIRAIAPGVTSATGSPFSDGGISSSVERDRGVSSMLQNLILGGIAFGVFAFHWGLATRSRAELERLTATPPDQADPNS